MKNLLTFSRLLLIILQVGLISACSKDGPTANTNDPFYLKGKKYADRAEQSSDSEVYKKAVSCYEKSWRVSQNYSAFLQLALIHEKLNEPSEAIHFYKQYIQYAGEEDSNYTYAQGALTDLETKYYKKLRQVHASRTYTESQPTKVAVVVKNSERGKATPRERNLITQNTMKSMEIIRLRKKLEKLEDKLAAIAIPSLPVTENRATTTRISTDAISYYTVAAGDNLYKISQKNYNTTRYWKEILDANKKVLPDASRLKVGQKLIMPVIE